MTPSATPAVLAPSNPWLAFRSSNMRRAFLDTDPVAVTRMLLLWSSLESDMAVIKALPTRAAAETWLDAPVLPVWAYRTCAPPTGDGPAASSVPASVAVASAFGLLCKDGAHVAQAAVPLDVIRLVNTIKLLDGECALARSFDLAASAHAWLLSPVLPAWLTPFLRRKRPTSAEVGRPAHQRAAEDGVLYVSSDEEGAQGDTVSMLASCLVPPTPKHSILSLHAIQESMPLPLTFVRNPATGLLPGGAGVGRSVAFTAAATHATPFDETASLVRAGGQGELGGRSQEHVGCSLSRATTCGPVDAINPAVPPVRRASGRRSRGGSSKGGKSVSLSTTSGVASVVAEHEQTVNQEGIIQVIDIEDTSSGAGDDDAVVVLDSAVEPPSKKSKSSPAVKYDMAKLAQRVLKHTDSIFVTGGGGVGKTRLLRELVSHGRVAQGGQNAQVAVVAPTGVAAAIAGGVTLHAYLRQSAGCFDETIGEEQDAARLYKKMNVSTKARLALTSLLLIDEVSMVSSRMFTLLISSITRAHEELNPGAGWKVVAFGDFFQLPPVWRADEDVFDTRGTYAFKSPRWRKLFGAKMLQLDYVWRQEDTRFIGMLNELRVGVVTPELQVFMEQRTEEYALSGAGTQDASEVDTTHIFPHRAKVDEHNEACLSSMEVITGCKRITYMAEDSPVGVDLTPYEVTAQLNRGLMAPAKLELCVGARVASCVSFKKDGVANGVVGTLIRFERVPLGDGADSGTYDVPVVSFVTPLKKVVEVFVPPCAMSLQAVAKDGPYATRFQVPLVLAWAVTMHRCQGLSMDAAVLDLASCFVAGMVYVALSRVRSLAGVHVISFEASKVKADALVKVFYTEQSNLDAVFADCTSHVDDVFCVDDAVDM